MWGQDGVTCKDSKPQLLSSVMFAFDYLHVNVSLGFYFKEHINHDNVIPL